MTGTFIALVLSLAPSHVSEASSTMAAHATSPVVTFADPAERWRSIDDVVMGGVSASEMVVEDGVAVFRGEVSLENNGGFASVRSAPQRHDLSSFAGVEALVRGDGKLYKLRLRTTAGFDGLSYEAAFTAPAGEWARVRFGFAAFEPVFRGRRVPGAPPLDPARVRTFGLLISDKQEGPFRLEIDEIRAWR